MPTTESQYWPTIRKLAEYEVWCNARTFEAAGVLPEAELFHRFAFGFGTIHETLFHVVEVMHTWSGCVGVDIERRDMIPYDAKRPLADLALWNDELATQFLAAIDASHAADVLGENRRLHQVFHLVGHGTHHRTQFITMLRLLGKDPPFEAGDFGGWSNTGGRS